MCQHQERSCLCVKKVLALTLSVHAVLTEILESIPFMQHPVLRELNFNKSAVLKEYKVYNVT